LAGGGDYTGEHGRSVAPLDQSKAAPRIDLGVVVAPGLAREVTAGIAENLLDDLRARYADVNWRTELAVDRLVMPPVPTTELFAAARRKLLAADWDLAVVVTDLPLRLARRAVQRHSNPTHGIAVVSLPALGPLHLRQRLRRAVLELVGELVGHGAEGQNVLRELGTDVVHRRGLAFVPTVLLSHVRLLLGMVRANRPWRFAARLYGALVAALAVSAYGVVTSDIWRLSGALSWWRLAVTSLVTLTVTRSCSSTLRRPRASRSGSFPCTSRCLR
jgi:hypothetical protein